ALVAGGVQALGLLGGDDSGETRDVAELAPDESTRIPSDEAAEEQTPEPDADESLSPASPDPEDEKDEDDARDEDDPEQTDNTDESDADDTADAPNAPDQPAPGNPPAPTTEPEPDPAPSGPATQPTRPAPPPPPPGQPGRDNCNHGTDRSRLWAQGMAGSSVRQIQCLLNHNYGQSLDVDGVFGPMSDKAVRSVQSCSGIDVDGQVGPDTWRYLDTPKRGCGR
ncbi:peptidoglycan-binding protein, partial [Streptomyces sp. SM12]|uniref:peptidoglycan-binding domain-containing protein n=1 Tax=Streptomyces sp. SM12 TaxID=1071602 RepID=UPI0011B0B6A0